MRGVTARRIRKKRELQAKSKLGVWKSGGLVDKLDTVVAIIANASIVIGLVVAWISYTAQVEQEKKDAAFQFVNRFSEGPIAAAQRHFMSELPRVEIERLSGITVPRRTMKTIIEQLVSTSDDEVRLRQDIISIVGYFDFAQACIDSGTCDYEVVSDHLSEMAGRYACLLLPYTNSLRGQLLIEGLGDGLRRFVRYDKIC